MDKYESVRSIPLPDVLRMLGFIDMKRRRGKQEWTMKCPFHQPRKNSTCFSFDNRRYHCFSCGEHGSGAIDLVMKIRKIGFTDAVASLQSGPATTQSQKESSQPPKDVVTENKPFAGTYEKYYVKSDWLKARGLTEETLIWDFLIKLGPLHPRLVAWITRRPVPPLRSQPGE